MSVGIPAPSGAFGVVSCLLNVLATCNVHFRDGSTWIIKGTVTMKQKLRIKPAVSLNHSVLTPGEPV